MALSLFNCRQTAQDLNNETRQSENKLKVLTTIAPLYSFAKNITGDLADVNNLLSPGTGPHEYSFSPSDIKKIKEADVIIKIGVDLENWLNRLISSAGGENNIIIDTSSGIEIINNDPHIWLSPGNAIVQVKNIRDSLIRADPENGKTYRINAEQYIKRLENLDTDIRSEIKTWRNKEFVAFHSAFLYFTRDYGLRQVIVIQEFPDKNATPRHIADVINIIKKTGVKAIFSDPLFSDKIAHTISKDLNLNVFSLDTLESGDISPEWYEDRMRANLLSLKKALQ